MDQVISNVESPVEDTACDTNAACTGMECRIAIDQDNVLVLQTELEFCELPPGMFVVLRTDDGTPVFEHRFTGSSSEDFTIPPDIPVSLFVSVVPGNYSVTVVVSDAPPDLSNLCAHTHTHVTCATVIARNHCGNHIHVVRFALKSEVCGFNSLRV